VPADPIDRLRTSLAGRYRLLQELGRGGMATVWRARDLRHDRDVAIKVLRPELSAAIGAERFQREIRLTAQLQHPNILPVFDSGDADGVLWYAMPLVEGASLRARLDREPRLPVDDAVAIATEVADALAYAHGCGIVHRDVKPENILLAHGHALVADFGIARAAAQAGGDRLTQTGMAIGTLAYMSPEQATADPALDGRADQYSLGCVLHEMLSGEVPFAGTSGPALLAKRLTEPVPALPPALPVPRGVRTVVARALERAPDARFATLAEVARALRDVPLASRLPSDTASLPAAAGTSARSRWPVVLAAAVLLAAVAFAARLGRRAPADASSDPSVAVLPFENRSADPGDVYLSDGVGDELIVRLTSQPALRVAPRSSVARLRSSALPLDSIAHQLDVAHLVTGTVARLGDSVRVNVELVDVARHRQQWAYQTVLPARAMGRLVDTLAVGVAGSLRPGDPRPPTPAAPRDSLAYDSYLRGQYLFYRFSERDVLAALAEYDRAIARDPAFAAAWMGRAGALIALISGVGRMPAREGIPAIRAAVDSALALDPSLGMAYAIRGQLATWFEWDWAAADRAFARALALAPREALALQRAAFLRSVRGEHDSALALSARARQLEPANALIWAGAANFNYVARRFDASVAMADQALALDPRFLVALDYRARSLARLGRADEAVSTARRLASIAPALGWPHASLAEVLAITGHSADARALLDSLERADPAGGTYPGHFARAFSALGDRDRAFAWLDRAFRDRASPIAYLLVEPAFDVLRGDPRYRRLLQDAGLPQALGGALTQP
jgi:serine/threonine-protein kinase